MSRIIRSSYALPKEEKKVEIQIKDLFTHEFGPDQIDVQQEVQITFEEINEERERVLTDAQHQIDAWRKEFEQYRHEQLNEIEQLKQMWEEEKLVLQQQAYDEGFSQGYEEGIHKANADMSESLQIANETVELAKINANKYIEEQEHVILDLALTAAERIIGSSLERNDDVFLSIVKRGLKEAREMKEIKIYVSPVYYQLVTKNRDELVELFPTDIPFFIFVNEDLNDTESYIETNHGRIVVSIDQQLNELRLRLNELLESKE